MKKAAGFSSLRLVWNFLLDSINFYPVDGLPILAAVAGTRCPPVGRQRTHKPGMTAAVLAINKIKLKTRPTEIAGKLWPIFGDKIVLILRTRVTTVNLSCLLSFYLLAIL